jgi:hypothetical protein
MFMAFWKDELMCSSQQLGLEMLRFLAELENQDFRKQVLGCTL